MKRITFISSLALCMCAQMSLAQDEILLNGEDRAYMQSSKTSQLGKFNNSTYFVTKTGVENLLEGQLYSSKKVGVLAINPKGDVYAVVKAGEKKVHICDLWDKNKNVTDIKLTNAVKTCCFSADGQQVLVVDVNGNLTVFAPSQKKKSTSAKQILQNSLTTVVSTITRTNKYSAASTRQLSFVPEKMCVSNDGKLLAVANGSDVEVVGLSSLETVASLKAEATVNSLEFADDSKELSVLSQDGTLSIYNTLTYAVKKQVNALGNAVDLGMHPETKYVAVLTSDSRIAVINLVDAAERFYMEIGEGGATDIFFTKDAQGIVYMVYNAEHSIHYKQVNELTPYLGKMVEDEVNTLMAEWEKQLPEETAEQYAMRVNAETRAAQMRLFEEQVATRMAGDLLSSSTMAFSKYNPETGMMQLDFDNMDPIFINVDPSEINAFTSQNDVEIRNPIYAVNENDKYELVYADVYNKKTGKTYTFDNREKKSLEYLQTDEGFMPLEYAQQNTENAMKLDEIKNDIVEAAKNSNSITDHTKITVKTEMLKNNDSTIDYKVSFGYSVDAEFSAKEDFPSGGYNYSSSKAAQAMLAIIKEALNTKFARYIKDGEKVTVKITGSADAAKIKSVLKYAGEYGDFVDAPVTKNNEQTTITVTTKDGITTNDQLAYLRAAGMKQNVTTNISALKNMDADYQIYIEQAEGVGGQFRRIFVDFVFKNAFK